MTRGFLFGMATAFTVSFTIGYLAVRILGGVMDDLGYNFDSEDL